MENLEMLVVNENGQMEINFEALELIASTEFVENVKELIDFHGNAANIKIRNFEYSVTVYLDYGDCGMSLWYVKDRGKIYHDIMNYKDMEILLEMRGK